MRPCLFAGNVTAALADHDDEFAFIVELLRHFRLLDRLTGADHRRGVAHEQARIFGQVRIVLVLRVALGVVDADAPQFFGRQDRRKPVQVFECVIRLLSGHRLAGIVERVGRDQRFHIGEVAADPLRQIDDAAVDYRAVARLSFHQIAHQSHCRPLREFCFDLRPASAGSLRIAAAANRSISGFGRRRAASRSRRGGRSGAHRCGRSGRALRSRPCRCSRDRRGCGTSRPRRR